MQPSMRDAIVLARQGARNRGIARLSAEAESLGVGLTEQRLESEFARDWIRAARASRSYTDRWLRKAVELDSPKAASVATQGSLERIAVTESSEAFTASRTAALEAGQLYEFGGAPPRIVSETTLMRSWDASLDSRTCPICDAADGTVVGINESFPAGEPGSVHAFCRCGVTLVSVNFRG